MLYSQDIQVFLIYKHPVRQGAFLNISFQPHLIKSPNLATDKSKGDNFQESFEQFGGLGPSCRSFSI